MAGGLANLSAAFGLFYTQTLLPSKVREREESQGRFQQSDVIVALCKFTEQELAMILIVFPLVSIPPSPIGHFNVRAVLGADFST